MKLPVQCLSPGMIVSYSCYGIKGELLLKRGAELTNSNISALKNRRVMALYVKTNYMSDEEMFEAKNILNEYVRIETLNLVQEWIEHNESKKFIRIEEKVKEIINEILNGKTPVYGLAEICTVDSYTYAHSVDVCILAVMTHNPRVKVYQFTFFMFFGHKTTSGNGACAPPNDL